MKMIACEKVNGLGYESADMRRLYLKVNSISVQAHKYTYHGIHAYAHTYEFINS